MTTPESQECAAFQAAAIARGWDTTLRADGRWNDMTIFGAWIGWQAARSLPAAPSDAGGAEPIELFDGYGVMQELREHEKAFVSPEAVSAVLDAVVRLIRARAALSSPAVPAQPAQAVGGAEPDGWWLDARDILETIELALKRGYAPAEMLDENSPIRDRIRAAIAKAAGSAKETP